MVVYEETPCGDFVIYNPNTNQLIAFVLTEKIAVEWVNAINRRVMQK